MYNTRALGIIRIVITVCNSVVTLRNDNGTTLTDTPTLFSLTKPMTLSWAKE